MVCSWMYLPWFSNAYVLEYMHLAPTSITTTTMWVAYICVLWKIISKNHIRIETWPKSDIKKSGNNVVFVHSSITFWIINKSNHFMPPFTCMSNKLHPTKTLVNPIHFQSFRNLFTSMHVFWMTFNYNIYVNHALNTPWQKASWIAYICTWLKSYLETSSHPWQ